MMEYEYEPLRKRTNGNDYKPLLSNQDQINTAELLNMNRPQGNQSMNNILQRQQTSSYGLIHEDSGEVTFKQNVNQSSPQINIRQQQYSRGNKYSQSKQGP